MKLVIIFGPQAVGKMTVGHELEKITDLKLFHNHMTIDLVSPFFSYSTDAGRRLVKLFRKEIFQEVAGSNLEGMIFTYVWNFNIPGDWDYIESVADIFKQKGGVVYYVELEADLEERLRRNRTEHRLLHKPSKRNFDHSENDLKTSMEKYRSNSLPDEIKKEHYIRINNADLNAATVAAQIKEKFNL